MYAKRQVTLDSHFSIDLRPGSKTVFHTGQIKWQFGSTQIVKERLFESNVELYSVEPNCYTWQLTNAVLLVSGFSRKRKNGGFGPLIMRLVRPMWRSAFDLSRSSELIFIWKVSHLDSFWDMGTRGLLFDCVSLPNVRLDTLGMVKLNPRFKLKLYEEVQESRLRSPDIEAENEVRVVSFCTCQIV